ncbi:uncharacterized protein LOC144077726 [Stigmatopora argus]
MCALLGREYKDMDIERHEKRDHSRGRVRCLDACIVVSIIVLYAVLGAVVALSVLMKLQSKENQVYQFGTEEPQGPTSSPAYKMQNFAFLEAISSELVNSTIKWEPVNYSGGQTVGSNYHFHPDQHWLRPTRAGSYFIYLNLNLTCTYKCSTGVLSVHVGDMLSCQVELLAESKQESKRCWTVQWLDSEKKLLTQMNVPKEGLENWKLELYGSNLGVFHVD